MSIISTFGVPDDDNSPIGPGTSAWDIFDQTLSRAQAMVAAMQAANADHPTVEQWLESLASRITNREWLEEEEIPVTVAEPNMTVGELIHRLSTLPPEAGVYVELPDGTMVDPRFADYTAKVKGAPSFVTLGLQPETVEKWFKEEL